MPAGGREIDPFRTLQPGLGLLKVPASCSMLEELQSIFKSIGIRGIGVIHRAEIETGERNTVAAASGRKAQSLPQ